MMREIRLAMPIVAVALLGGCANINSKQQVLAAGSQVEVRSYQTRTYDTDNKTLVMRAVMATLQDLRFVIDKADDTVGVVSATKLDGYALSISVSVRPVGEQMTVRANAQYNLKAIEEPGPYQDFFAALDKGLFLDNNLIENPQELVAQKSASSQTLTQTEKVPTEAYEFYGEAEAEIKQASMDTDLWARALVEVEGDEQKRKARYIVLRAEQMFQQSSGVQKKKRSVSTGQSGSSLMANGSVVATSISGLTNSSSGSTLDLSGTYVSEITSNSHWAFEKASERRIVLVFKQQGKDIVATNDTFDLKISGRLDDDRISFFTWPNDITSHEIRGEWRIVDGGARLEGTWMYPNGAGKWNLTRLR